MHTFVEIYDTSWCFKYVPQSSSNLIENLSFFLSGFLFLTDIFNESALANSNYYWIAELTSEPASKLN